MLLETSDPAADRRLNLLLVVASVTAIAVMIFTIIGVPKILSNASTTEAIRRGNEINACRAEARGTLDDGAARLQAARARLDGLTNEGLEASVRDLDDELLRIVGELPDARQAVKEQADALEDATVRYTDLVELSRKDPNRFLDLCRSERT